MWDAFLRWLLFWRPPCQLRRVIVNFTHDSSEALEGILWSARGHWVILRDVSAMKAGQPPVPMIGEVVVHRTQIAYLQVLP